LIPFCRKPAEDQETTPLADVYEPISLGTLCETKYQLVRHLYFQEFPKKTPLSLRGMMSMSDHGERLYGWHAFDWQCTTTDSVIHYLEQDFAGVFERADLTVYGGKVVIHKTLHTNHFHDFEAVDEWTEERLDRAYDAARVRFDKRAAKFREHLKTPGPYLYVHLCSAIPEPAKIQRLLDLLGRHPDHGFHLLLMAPDAAQADVSAFGGKVSVGVRSGNPDDVTRAWEWWQPYDGEWDEALSRFRLVRQGQKTPGPAQPAAPPVLVAEAPPEERRPNLFNRLLRRG
jgi:hypothetical protein